jgi:hypothetical protein
MGAYIEVCCCTGRDSEKHQKDILTRHNQNEIEKKYGRKAALKFQNNLRR